MDLSYTKLLLLTANVGSIFEEPDKMLPIWLREFLATISRLEPEFVAIHCQEVGGKNYEETMQHVNKFIKMLLASEEMAQFDRARVFLDEDFTAVEKFTALGSLYFVHRSVRLVEIFDFHEKKFVPVEGKEVLSGNIEHVHIKEKSKFPQEFFPDFVWSRKGFIRTRWNLNGTAFDLVNIHLFHDISNLAAMEKSPSTYSSHRERALLHTVERFETDEYDKVPFFIFGDFNFRMDTNKLVKQLTSKATEERIKGKKNDVSAVLYKEEGNDKVILKVGKKDFHHFDHSDVFSCDKAMSLMMYDSEPRACRGKLFEYSVTFPPSYPFSENMEEGTSYMPTRCPGWCDRIMMSHSALPLIVNIDGEFPPEYSMIGRDICMGDHKPILLNLKIFTGATPGMIDQPQQRDPRDDIMAFNSRCTPEHAKTFVQNGEAEQGTPSFSDDEFRRETSRASKSPSVTVISINGEMVVANDMDDINIHDYMRFEVADLVTDKFKSLIKQQHKQQQKPTANADAAGDADGDSNKFQATLNLPGSTTPRLKTTRSFKNVVSNVIKSDSILRYMRRFKHRSDSESDDEDDEDEHNSTTNTNATTTSCNDHHTSNFLGVDKTQTTRQSSDNLPQVVAAGNHQTCPEADDDGDVDPENINNNNNFEDVIESEHNCVVVSPVAAAAATASLSLPVVEQKLHLPPQQQKKRKHKCHIQ